MQCLKIIILVIMLMPFTLGATNVTLWTLNLTIGNRSNMTPSYSFITIQKNTIAPYNNLLAYWNFDYNLEDISGNSYDLNTYGSVVPFVGDVCNYDDDVGSDCENRQCHDWSGYGYAMPLYNKALFFSQCVTTDNYVDTSGIGAASPSVCLWYYLDNTYLDSPVTSSPSASDVIFWKFDRLAFTSNPSAFFTCPSYAPSTNTWKHACLTIDNTNDEAIIYEDGVNKCSFTCDTYDEDESGCTGRGCYYTAYSCYGSGNCHDWDGDETGCYDHPVYCTYYASSCTTTGECSYLPEVHCSAAGCAWDVDLQVCYDDPGLDCSIYNSDQMSCQDRENYGACAWTNPSCDGGWECSGNTPEDCESLSESPYYCSYNPYSCDMPTSFITSTLGRQDTGDYYKGAMDEVMIFDGELTPSEIGNIYNRTSNRFKNNGTLKWNQNLGTSELMNFSLPYWNTTQLSNLSVKVNNGSEQYFTPQGKVLNYNLSGIGLTTNATIYLQYRAGNGTFSFYTPITGDRLLISHWSNAVSAPSNCWLLTSNHLLIIPPNCDISSLYINGRLTI